MEKKSNKQERTDNLINKLIAWEHQVKNGNEEAIIKELERIEEAEKVMLEERRKIWLCIIGKLKEKRGK